MRGFTLIEVIAVIVILGSLAAVAVPTFLDLRTSAINVAHLNIAASFYGGVQNARAAWHVAPNGGAQVAALNHGFGAGQASFTAGGWLIGRNNAAQTLSDAQCAEAWRVALPQGPTAIAGAWTGPPGTGYAALLHPDGWCIYGRLAPDGVVMSNLAGTNIVYIAYDPFGTAFTPGTVWTVNRSDAWQWFNWSS